MLRKGLIGLIFASALTFSAAAAEIVNLGGGAMVKLVFRHPQKVRILPGSNSISVNGVD